MSQVRKKITELYRTDPGINPEYVYPVRSVHRVSSVFSCYYIDESGQRTEIPDHSLACLCKAMMKPQVATEEIGPDSDTWLSWHVPVFLIPDVKAIKEKYTGPRSSEVLAIYSQVRKDPLCLHEHRAVHNSETAELAPPERCRATPAPDAFL